MTATETSLVEPARDGDLPVLLQALVRNIAALSVESGVPLVRQGELSDVAYLLTEGTVKVVAETAYGAVPLATISAPRLIGEIGALSATPRTASIIAASPLTVYPVPRAMLIDVGRSDPQFLISVISQLGRQMEGMNRTISLYSNALQALETRNFDSRILEDLSNPSPQLMEFSAAFRRFANEIVSKRRRHDELASAAIIQQSYLPRPSILAGVGHALELHADMRPARNVGGDFYDYFVLGEDRVVIAVGDVCGKGIPASLFMAVVMTVLRMSAREESDARAVIARANAILCRDNASTMFATLFFGVLDLRDGTLEYCNCGHNPPLLVDAAGTVRELPATGLPLALDDGTSAATEVIRLSPSDLLVLYSDGVTEALNPLDEEYSEPRLHETVRQVRGLGAQAIVTRIFDSVDVFAEDTEQADDITCLVLRRTGATKE